MATTVNHVEVVGNIHEGRYQIEFVRHLEVMIEFDLLLFNASRVNCRWVGEEAYSARWIIDKIVHKDDAPAILIKGELYGSGCNHQAYIRVISLEELKGVE